MNQMTEKCPKCGYDLKGIFRAIGARGGRAGKGKKVDPKKMQKAARARWRRYRERQKSGGPK